MKVNLAEYSEIKDRPLRRKIWYVLNRTLFRILSWKGRARLLNHFGASIGNWYAIYRLVDVYAPWNLKTGERVCIGPHVEIYNKAMVTIGDHSVVSQGVYLCTASHDISSPTMDIVVKPIEIGSDVWIGARAIILPGVKIAEGTVVGAGAVVTKATEPWSVVGGNPAKLIKKRVLKSVEG